MRGIEKQCTTLEQSKKLVELGFTKESASARIVHLLRNDWVVVTDNFVCYDEEYPCWTIADMMRLIKYCKKFRNYDIDDFEKVSIENIEKFKYFNMFDNLKDNLFDCLVWLKENKYL